MSKTKQTNVFVAPKGSQVSSLMPRSKISVHTDGTPHSLQFELIGV